MNEAVANANSSDKSAASIITGLAVGGMVLMMLLGGYIAWKSAQSITIPLTQLIAVSRQIANAGDLDSRVEIYGQDEVAQLALTFNNMVLYLREMAGLSESIAGGDLSVQINPRSTRDTLGTAFRK